MANGKTLLIAIHQVTLRYTITNIPHKDTFVVVPISTHPLILSMPFLKCTDVLLKWKERSIHFPHAPKPADVSPVIPLTYDSKVTTPKPVHSAKQKKWNSCHKKGPLIATPDLIENEPIIKTVSFYTLYLKEDK